MKLTLPATVAVIGRVGSHAPAIIRLLHHHDYQPLPVGSASPVQVMQARQAIGAERVVLTGITSDTGAYRARGVFVVACPAADGTRRARLVHWYQQHAGLTYADALVRAAADIAAVDDASVDTEAYDYVAPEAITDWQLAAVINFRLQQQQVAA